MLESLLKMDGIMDGSYMKFNIFKYYFSVKTLTICHLSVTSEYVHLHLQWIRDMNVDTHGSISING
jgi:hypothetical protein